MVYLQSEDAMSIYYKSFDINTGILNIYYEGKTDKEKYGWNKFSTPSNYKVAGHIITKDVYITARNRIMKFEEIWIDKLE